MSEIQHALGENGESIRALPHDFLKVDQERLVQSAGKVRGLAELQQSLDSLASDFWAVATLDQALATGEEWNAKQRDIRRGGILGYQLALDSMPERNSIPADGAISIATLAAGGLQANAFTKASKTLIRQARWLRQTANIPPEERRATDPARGMFAEGHDDKQARYESELTAMVDSVLDASGVGTYFNDAVTNLSGSGLENDPTDLQNARYGAAVTLLGLATIIRHSGA